MRGLLYSSLLRNRGFIIGTAVYSVIAAVVGVVLIYLSRSYSDIAPVLTILVNILPLISIVLALEGVDRELENSLKTRFANYALSAVTPRNFIMTELLKNFCFSAYGTVMGMLMLAIFALADASAFPDVGFLFRLYPMAGILSGLIQWVMMPLVIKFKNAEKAGMVVGLIIGFGTVLPINLIQAKTDGGFEIDIKSLITPVPTAVFLLAVVLIYALFYVLLVRRVERGNIC
jgi:hypothetical protein